MASKGPLTMARDNVIRVRAELFSWPTLETSERSGISRFPEYLHKGDGPDKWRACYAVWERQVENSDHMLGILEGNICAAVSYKRGTREFGIGWGWRS